MHVCVYVCMYVCTYVRTYVRMCVCMYVHIRMYMYNSCNKGMGALPDIYAQHLRVKVSVLQLIFYTSGTLKICYWLLCLLLFIYIPKDKILIWYFHSKISVTFLNNTSENNAVNTMALTAVMKRGPCAKFSHQATVRCLCQSMYWNMVWQQLYVMMSV